MEILSNLSNWEIFGIIVLILIFGGFIWRVAKRLFVLVVIAGLVLFGLYKFSPETLHDWFGKENVEWFAGKAKDGANDLKVHTKDGANKARESLDKN